MKIDLEQVLHISETSLTIRGSRRRTTIPAEVVEYLGLVDGDKVRWILKEDGSVQITPVRKMVSLHKQRTR